MAYDDDDADGDDFAFFALALASVYFFWQFMRDRQAAAYGGGYFEPGPPAMDSADGILNILVPLNLSPSGAAFIKKQEGFRANPYPDGKGKTSIGYGHQIQSGESIVPPITQAEGDRLFAADVAAAVQDVGALVQVQLTQSQFDALADFRYNVGRAAFQGSTLLRLLNAGDYQGAAGEFSRWVHSGGQVSDDLVARRASEQSLFNGG